MSRAVARIQSALGDPRVVRTVVLFVSAGVLLYLLAIFWFGWKDTAAALASLGLKALLLGAVLSSSSYLWRFGRWESSLRCVGYQVPKWRHFAIYMSGLGLTATPGKSGETFRSALLLSHGVRISHSLAAFIVDRASDVLGMCLLGFVAAWVLGHALAWAWLLAFAVLLSGSCVLPVSCSIRVPLLGGAGWAAPGNACRSRAGRRSWSTGLACGSCRV